MKINPADLDFRIDLSDCIDRKIDAALREQQKQRIELEALITEREGMIAENAHRAFCGNSPAFGEDSFLVLADRMRAIAKGDEA